MKLVEIRKMSTGDLASQSSRIRDEIHELRRQLKLGQLQNVRQVRSKKRDLARILTVLAEQLRKESV